MASGWLQPQGAHFKIDIGHAICEEGLGLCATQQKPLPKEIMNWKKLFIAFIAAFVFLIAFGFLYHGDLIKFAIACAMVGAACAMVGPLGGGKPPHPPRKNIIIAFIAAFVFLFVFGFLWYGTLMHGAHQEVPTLWRPEAEFKDHFLWLVFGHIVMAFFLALLCAECVPAGGAGTGAKLGILIALVYAGADLITFAVQPLTTKILFGWIVGDLIQFAVAGAIIGLIYKLCYKPSSAATT